MLDAYSTLETCGIFLDMSKVFDKFWHERLIYVTQVSILGPLLFLIYPDNLRDNLSSTAKDFAEDSPLFYLFCGINTSAELNKDLQKILD